MKLFVLDIEGTIFERGVVLEGAQYASTVWQGIAIALGPQAIAEEIETHRQWEAGNYSRYVDWMRATVEIHERHGLTERVFHGVISSAEYHPHAVEVLASVARLDYVPVLISGGFKELAERAQRDIGIHHAFAACEYFFDGRGLLTSYNLLPCDFYGKVDFIELMLDEYGLSPDDWVFMGDGGNDAQIASLAPLSIGFRPDDRLSAVVDHVIDDYRDLLSVLKG